MDSSELNKYLAGFLGTCFIVMSIAIVSDSIFAAPHPEKPGYAIEATEGAGGGVVADGAEVGEHVVHLAVEVGPRGLDRHGIVRDAARYDEVRAAVTGCADDCGWQVHDWLDSPITGGDGNREFFIHATRRAA